ncbi:MAG: hypothetical protein ACK4VI_00640 [Alphaproteobacteria bacterium]
MSTKFSLSKLSLLKSSESSVDFKAITSFNWHSLKKYLSPQATEDLNTFLEKLPINAGQTMLMIAGVAWASAGAVGLYVTVQLQQLTELSAKLQEAEALKPIVPQIANEAINPSEVKRFTENIKAIYKDLNISDNGSTIVITANSTANFGQWREAIGHVQNGGSGWRVNIERLCVGRECDREPLAAALSINKVEVTTPNLPGMGF